MKFRFVYTFFSLALLALIFSSSSGGRANAANAGNTGAPGDAALTCVTCHGNNAAIQVTLAIDILDETGASIASTGYTPGQTYDVVTTIDVAEGSPAGFGFQILALNAPSGQNGDPVNAWSEPASNVQIASANGGRSYAEHQGVSNNNVFQVKWTAPDAGAGVVTFYSCGNGVNGNGETGGDNAACNTLELMENTMTNTTNIETLSVAVAPNPAIDFIQLKTFSPNSGEYDLILTDMLGQVVHREIFFMPQGENLSPIDLQRLPAGVYTLQMVGNGQQLAQQVILR